MLKDAPAELKLVIAGNHDITLDEEYYARVGVLRHRWRVGFTDDLAGHPRTHTPRGQQTQTGKDEGLQGLQGLPENPSEIKALYTDPATVAAGIHYLEEGLYTFTVPSTQARLTVYASPYTPEFCSWAFAYERHVDRYNPTPTPGVQQRHGAGEGAGAGFVAPNPVPDWPGVDVMLTHGPPHGVFDRVVPGGGNVGCENLMRAVRRARPRVHVFGHIHEGYGAGRMDWGSGQVREIRGDPEEVLEQRGVVVDATEDGEGGGLKFGEETLFVNASVVTVRYHAVNAPWVVDMDLPVADADS